MYRCPQDHRDGAVLFFNGPLDLSDPGEEVSKRIFDGICKRKPEAKEIIAAYRTITSP